MAERMLFLRKLKEAASKNIGNEDQHDLTNSEQEVTAYNFCIFAVYLNFIYSFNYLTI